MDEKPRRLTWVIKASKLCNLRCAYCYEWDELSDPARMSPELWKRILVAMRTHNEIETERYKVPNASAIVWHGGEPLLLPTSYVEDVMAIQHEVFGKDANRTRFPNNMQSNLYRVTDNQIALLKKHDFNVSVSLDVVPNVRLSVNGKPTERDVIANVARLREAGFDPAGITVLASHTAKDIIRVYEFFASLQMPMRILPLFKGPSTRPMDRFNLSGDEIIEALETLFRHWMQETKIPIVPFTEYFEAALRKMSGLQVARYNRAVGGDKVFVVNTNGDLYLVQDAYNVEKRLGNLMDQTFEEIVASPRYRESIEEEISEQKARCGQCEYRYACTGWPLFSSRYAHEDLNSPCPIASRCMAFMERYLREEGYDRETLTAMAG